MDNDNDAAIWRYINASRKNKPHNLDQQSKAPSLVDEIFKYDAFSDLNVKCISIHTRQMETATVSIGDSDYLLIDEYQNEVFRILNALLFTDKPKEYFQFYVSKWISEVFSNMGRHQEAHIYAVRHHKTFPGSIRIGDEENIKQATYTFVQQVFMISHELYHILLANDPNMRESQLRTTKQLLDIHMSSYEEEDGKHENMEELSEVALKHGVTLDELMSHRAKFRNQVANMSYCSHTLEEAAVDLAALVATFEVCNAKHGVGHIDLGVGVILSHIYLDLFERIKIIILNGEKEIDPSGSKNIQQAHMRYEIVRQMILFHVYMHLGQEEHDRMDLALKSARERCHTDYEMLVNYGFREEYRRLLSAIKPDSITKEQSQNYKNASERLTSWESIT